MHFPPMLPKRMDIALSIGLLAVWGLMTLDRHWGSWPPDLSALYLAGRFFQSGQFDLIYGAMDNLQAWAPELSTIGHPDAATFPYLYPPLWAVVSAPFAAVAPEQVFNGFYVMHTAMIAASVILAYRVAAPPVPLYLWTLGSILLLSVSLIATLALFHNQLQITVTFFTLLAFERYKHGAMIAAGTALAIAASIKILPAALGLIFLLDRRFRAARAAALAGLALLALSLIFAGPALHFEFLRSVNHVLSEVLIEHTNWNLESFLAQLQSLATAPPLGDTPLGPLRIDEPAWITIANYGCLAVSLAVVIRKSAHAPTLRLMGFLVILTLTGPLAWIHHYLTVLLLLPMMFCQMTPLRALAVLLAFGWLTSIQAFTWANGLSEIVHAQAMLGTATMIALLLVLFKAKP